MGNVHYVCLRNANQAAHSGFETQRRRHQKSITGVPVAPKKDMCPPKTLKKKSPVRQIFFQIKINFHIRLFELKLSKVFAHEAEMCFSEKL